MPKSDLPAAEPLAESGVGSSAASAFWFGAALIAVGSLFLWHAMGIERTGVSQEGDPGARLFPLLLAGILLAGGIAYACLGIRGVVVSGARPLRREGPARSAKPWLLVVGLLVALALMPYAGFTLAMGGFCIAGLLLLGGRWYVAAAATAMLIAAVKILFTRMFEVQLPEGVLELWI